MSNFLQWGAWRWWTICVVSFALTGLNPLLSVFVILALVALLRATTLSLNLKTLILGGVLAGTAKAASGLAWIWAVYPFVRVDISPGVGQIATLGTYWIVDSFVVGIGLIITVVVTKYLQLKNSSFIWFFPFTLVIGEVLGSMISSIYSLGPGSDINPDYSFGYVGYAVANLPGFLSLAIWEGVYGLSLIGGLLAVLIYISLFIKAKRDTNRLLIYATSALLAIILSSNIFLTMRERPTELNDIIAVNTHFNASLFLNQKGFLLKETQVKAAARAALEKEPEVIILPEDSRLTEAIGSPAATLQYIKEYSGDNDVILVDSGRTQLTPDQVVLRTYIYDTTSNEVYLVDKQKLVPQGEYISYLMATLLPMFKVDKIVENLERNQNYQPGPLDDYSNVPSNIPSVLFCFESTVPLGVTRIKRKEMPSFIAHPVSHSWFHDSEILKSQLRTMLRIQAVWNNVTIVQAGNMAEEMAYRPDGTTVSGKELESTEYWSLYRLKE